MPALSSRSQVAAFMAMDVLREANALEAKGRRVFHLETGQPGTPAPRAALEAVRAALDRDPLGYTEALGRVPLKEAIARHYGDAYGLNIDPARVVVTTGSSSGFILSFLAVFDAGQKLVMGLPGYPAYRNTASALNLEPLLVPAGPQTGFRLPLDTLAAIEGAHGMLIASPGNPTGTILPPEDLAAIANLSDKKGWHLISDEIYHGLSYEQPAKTILSYAPDAIVVNSFSKFYSMTGWRIGWLIVPQTMVRTIERLAQNLFISPPAISQVAATAALSAQAQSELNGHVEVYRRNRDVLAAALKHGGVARTAPATGAFYIYADVSLHCRDSAELAPLLLAETGIAATPGWDFDPQNGGSWLRLSYAGAATEVAAAAEILAPWLARRSPR
jgi:aspartate/methionine/tyrosine aminotransferase